MVTYNLTLGTCRSEIPTLRKIILRRLGLHDAGSCWSYRLETCIDDPVTSLSNTSSVFQKILACSAPGHACQTSGSAFPFVRECRGCSHKFLTPTRDVACSRFRAFRLISGSWFSSLSGPWPRHLASRGLADVGATLNPLHKEDERVTPSGVPSTSEVQHTSSSTAGNSSLRGWSRAFCLAWARYCR